MKPEPNEQRMTRADWRRILRGSLQLYFAPLLGAVWGAWTGSRLATQRVSQRLERERQLRWNTGATMKGQRDADDV